MPKKQKRRPLIRRPIFLIVITAIYIAWALGRPLPLIQPAQTTVQFKNTTLQGQLDWPAKGQAAIATSQSGVLATHGAQKPVPIASTAKVMTALAIMKKKPFAFGKTGPTITITDRDITIYNDYVARDGSVMMIEWGEKLSQYQMLQAILLPSANNIADSLAIWAFGSLKNYSTYANSYARELGLTGTSIGSDASGLDPSTVSTAHDLVLLGKAALREPVIAEIVGQTSATLPVAGEVRNVNFLLGRHGIVGIKTGNTDEAGGVFLAAKQATVAGQPLTIVTATLGVDNLYEALATSPLLLQSAEENFDTSTILKSGAIISNYKLPWGGDVPVVASKSLDVLAWKGTTVPATVELQPIKATARAKQTVGSITVTGSNMSAAQNVPAVLAWAPSLPSPWWRLTHPL